MQALTVAPRLNMLCDNRTGAGRDVAGLSTACSPQPTGRLSKHAPEGGMGEYIRGVVESGLAASATALHSFEQGRTHVGCDRRP